MGPVRYQDPILERSNGAMGESPVILEHVCRIWGTVENEFSVIHNKIAIKQTEIHDDRDCHNNTVITKIVTSLMLSGCCHKSNKAFSRSISVVTSSVDSKIE